MLSGDTWRSALAGAGWMVKGPGRSLNGPQQRQGAGAFTSFYEALPGPDADRIVQAGQFE